LQFEAVPSQSAPPLPHALPPGALPAVQRLQLHLPGLRSPLPAGWSAETAALPALVDLDLRMSALGPLPPEWAGGFRGLKQVKDRFLGVVCTAVIFLRLQSKLCEQ
jgi:hypothetical protein